MDVLRYARWAPSPHNMQPWLFRLDSDTEATLFYDPKRLLPGTNPTGSFMVVGFGILNETMSIAAAPWGLEVEVQYLNVPLDYNQPGPRPFAKLKLVESSDPEPLNRELIMERRTSRLPYDERPVSQAVMEQLATIAREYGNVFEWTTEQREIDWVVRLNADTMFFDMADPVARNEVGSWIRYSKAEAKRKADGLAAYAMLFNGAMMKLFVKANWMFRIPGIYHAVRLMYERTMKGTRTVAWLSGPFEELKDWDAAGRMMARMWLTMTKHGVYLHPFGSVITNDKSHKLMANHFANSARKDDLWLLVRLGHSDEPPQAQRLTLEQLIIK